MSDWQELVSMDAGHLASEVVELRASLAASEQRCAELREALERIANHPTGWPPPEEENSSMRGIASAALAEHHPETGEPDANT